LIGEKKDLGHGFNDAGFHAGPRSGALTLALADVLDRLGTQTIGHRHLLGGSIDIFRGLTLSRLTGIGPTQFLPFYHEVLLGIYALTMHVNLSAASFRRGRFCTNGIPLSHRRQWKNKGEEKNKKGQSLHG
jgi:hypothetical protein